MKASSQKPTTETLFRWRKDHGPYARFVRARDPIPDPFPPIGRRFEPIRDDPILVQDELDQRLLNAETRNREFSELLDRLLRVAERERYSRGAADALAGIIQAFRFNGEGA